VIQADLDANKVVNTATATTIVGDNKITSDPVSLTVTGTQGPALDLVKVALEPSFHLAGDKIDYTYTLTNIGNVTLDGPFTITDDKITDPNSVACPTNVLTLEVGKSITCTATYTVTLADLDKGEVVNTAVGHGLHGDSPVVTVAKIVTVKQAELQSVNPATATPGHPVTPPPTSGTTDSSNGSTVPLFALLLCLAFGGLGLLAVGAQRRSARR
jgi:hypothetical protein